MTDGQIVAKIPRRPNVRVGRPRAVVTSAMRSRYGSVGCGGGYFGSGGGASFGGGGFGMGDLTFGTSMGSGGNIYSPEMSTDFLELGQSLDEMRQYYRFFEKNDPFVQQAIRIQTELPISKVRFGMPKARDRKLARKAQRFCEKWARRVGLTQRLLEIVHDYHKIGEVIVWAEDTNPEMPKEVTHDQVSKITEDGEPVEEWKRKTAAKEEATQWVNKNYKGWTKIRILPPEQIHMEAFPFTDEIRIQLVIDSKTKAIVDSARKGDEYAERIVDSMPPEIVEAAQNGSKVDLNTDPEAGSFVSYLARKGSQYEARGSSLLQCVLRILVYRDKLRQAQTSIASRNMTPTRVVWSEGMDPGDINALREQIDQSLIDPDYSIIANYQINWEEMPSNGRLLELSGEYDLTDRQMYAGLGVTESLLSGESSYGGDRINSEVINQRFMLLREILQHFVEENLLKPMCARWGFIEIDEDGEEVVIFPPLSFTRLGIRDNDSMFDQLFNLYQKGSLDIWTLFELLNIDGELVKERLQNDALTLQDPNYNEALRGMLSRVGDDIAENSNLAQKIAKDLGLTYEKAEEGGGRF